MTRTRGADDSTVLVVNSGSSSLKYAVVKPDSGEFLADGIIEQDMKNGLFNYATIHVFLVNWADLTQGILRLRRGWLGVRIQHEIWGGGA